MDHEGAIKRILERLEQELPPHLSYHGHHHTIDVLDAAERIGRAEGLNADELNLLLVAAAYHDCGFLKGHSEHEKKGCVIANETLPLYGFSGPDIDQICRMIMATKVPQEPTDRLSEILCDADLDYLGRDDFESVAQTLFQELNHLGVVPNLETWNRIQLSFLEEHDYHTEHCRQHNRPKKQLHLDSIRMIVNGYDPSNT